MADAPWKRFERRVAEFFGTVRNSLSGSNSKITASDSLSETLYIECKKRKSHNAVTTWRDAKAKSKKEGKIPVVCLSENGQPGFWIVCHSSDFAAVANVRNQAVRREKA